MLPIGTTFTFTSPYQYGPVGWSDADFAARKGTEAEVIGHLTENTDDHDFDEVGPMYRIRFTADGIECVAWPEEVEA